MSPQCHSHTWHLPSALETGRTLEKNAAQVLQEEGGLSGVFCEGSVDLRQIHGYFSKDRFIQDQQEIAHQGLQPWQTARESATWQGQKSTFTGGERWEGASKQSPRLFLFCCPVTKLCPTPCYPMDSSMPGFPVLHCLLEFAQIHVSDAIQVSHPLLSPSPPAFNLSQHQGLFWWVDSSHQVAKVLKLQLQDQSFQWIFRLSPYQERREISFSCQSLLLSQNLRAPLFGLHTLFNRRFCLFFIPAFNKPRTWGLRESDMTERCHFHFSLNKPSPTCLSLSKIWMDGQKSSHIHGKALAWKMKAKTNKWGKEAAWKQEMQEGNKSYS